MPQVKFWLLLRLGRLDELTRRQLFEGPLSESNFDYGTGLASFLYVMAIVVTYWILAPVVTILGSIYFAGIYIVYKYQFLYVYEREFETGGDFFPAMVNSVMLSVQASVLLMTAYVSIKEGIRQAPILVLLSILVAVYWRRLERLYLKRSRYVAHSMVVDADTRQDEQRSDCLCQTFMSTLYMQPLLSDDAASRAPVVHRINDIPLISASGFVSSEYLEEHEYELEDFFHYVQEKFCVPSPQLDDDEHKEEHANDQDAESNAIEMVLTSRRSAKSKVAPV